MDTEPGSVFACMFAVDETPYCVWDPNPTARTETFLGQFDGGYFEFLARQYSAALETEESQRAALAMRVAYGQAGETLLALVCAALQAPDCVWAWLLRYRENHLRSLVKKIEMGEKFPAKQIPDEWSWDGISRLLLGALRLHDEEKERRVKDGFATLWRRIGGEYLDEKSRWEYNSAKHGMRVSSGGFELRIGEYQPGGIEGSPEGMRTLMASRFGSGLLIVEPLYEDRVNFRVRQWRRNWSAGSVAARLWLADMSLRNLVSSLKISNGATAGGQQFVWPDDAAFFERAWDGAFLGAVTMETEFELDSEDLLTGADVMAVYEGTKRRA